MFFNEFGVSIKHFRSNAKDYFNLSLNSYFEKEGIIHEFFYDDTPRQNGVVAER